MRKLFFICALCTAMMFVASCGNKTNCGTSLESGVNADTLDTVCVDTVLVGDVCPD